MSSGMELANLLYAQLQLNSEQQQQQGQQSFSSFDASSLSDPKSSSSTPSDRYLSSRPSLCASLSLPEAFYQSQLSPSMTTSLFQNGVGRYQDQLNNNNNNEVDGWRQDQSTTAKSSDRRSCSLGDALGRQILQSTTSGSSQSSTPSGRYKTELCRPFEEHGTCRYGSKCQFAHGRSELRTVSRHPKYKTDLCRTYHSTGLCPYGPRCHFVHNEEERGTEIQQYRAEDHQMQLQQQQRQMLIIQQQQQQQQQQAAAAEAASRRRGLRQQVSVFGDDDDDAETPTLQFNAAFPTRLERPRASLPSVGLYQQQQQTSWENQQQQQQQQQMRRMSVADPLHRYHQQQSVVPQRSQLGLTNPPPGFASTFNAQPTCSTSSLLQLPKGVAGSIGSAAESIPSTASSVTDSPSPSPTSGLFLSEDPVWQQPSTPSTSWAAAASVPAQAGRIDELTSSSEHSSISSSSSSQMQDLLALVSQIAPDQLEKIIFELYLNHQQPQQPTMKPTVQPSQPTADLFATPSPAADPWSQQPFHQFSLNPSAALSAGNAVW